MIVTKHGEPIWIDLLIEDYVEGGKFSFNENIGKGVMKVPAGRKSLIIDLNHEEFSTVRQVESKFDVEITKDIPVSLSARIMPAQGNARLEVVPDQEGDLGNKRVYANWETMQDTGKQPKQFLDSLSRVCPPITMRRHNYDLWRNVRSQIGLMMENRTWDYRQLKDIRLSLQNRYEREYPISSDGTVSLYQEILDEFISQIINRLHPKDLFFDAENWLFKEGWRIIAHSFAKHHDIELLLDEEINRYGTRLRPPTLLAVGRCIRSPELASKFIKVFLARLEQNTDRINNWLRAFSELAKYRASTFEKLQNGVSESLWQHLIPIFENELRPGDASHRRILPHSFVGLAFLLRRRAFEPSFMPPQSTLAQEAKNVAYHAQEMVRQGSLHFAERGAINMEMEHQRFVDYIDKKGHGSIAIADWDWD